MTLIARKMLIIMLAVILTGVNVGQLDGTKVNIPIADSLIASAQTRGEQIDTVKVLNPYNQVVYYTKLYAKQYDVPEKYLFRVLNIETNFIVGDTTYNPFSRHILNSQCLGPYQILLSTGRAMWADSLELRNLSNAEFKKALQYDLEFNVHTAVKLISHLYKTYGAWDKTFSVYNQGTRGAYYINGYARKVVANF
jgi:hypothetical protein